MKKEIKEIRFRGTLKGNGIVNYDGENQSFLLNNIKDFMHLNTLIVPIVKGNYADSVKYAKKEIISTPDGEIDYRIKISRDCLRHAIFNDVEHANPAILHVPHLYTNFITSPCGIVRGFMFTKKDETSYVRASSLQITDAVQIPDDDGNMERSIIETCSSSGARNDTSIFYRETIGAVRYQFDGRIDLKQLQFFSTDPVFGRMCDTDEHVANNMIPDAIKRHYGEDASFETGCFSDSFKSIGKSYCESGVLFGQDVQKKLVQYILDHLKSFYIGRAGAFAEVESIEVAAISDIISETDQNAEWMPIDQFDINSYDIHMFYVKCTEDDFNERNKFIEKYNEIMNKRKNEKIAIENEKKERKKAKKSEESI